MKRISLLAIVAFGLVSGAAFAQSQQSQPPQAQSLPQQASQDGQQPSGQGTNPGQQQPAEGQTRWKYETEQSQPGIYVQPGQVASLPLEVERHRNSIAALEDRVERLEITLKAAVETINAQSEALESLSRR